MFIGRFRHSIDDRNRVTVPSRFREELLSDLPVVTYGFDKSLVVYPLSYFESVAKTLNETTISDPVARNLRRMMFANAESQELDKSGRIIISTELLNYADIKDNVVIVGNWDYFEIWSEDLWTSKQYEIQNAQLNSNQFSQYKVNPK